MSTLFVADIHLGSEHPEISRRFHSFLRRTAPGMEALYILGDLFEFWIGDDALQTEHHGTFDVLRKLAGGGLPVYIMHGNRDFLLGEQFAAATGCQLIADPVVIDLHGTPTLLMHGDSLCSDDTGYQALRKQLRDPAWQQQFLSETVDKRLAYAHRLRDESQRRNRGKAAEIMDVNAQAVVNTMKQHGVTRLIHGHTHRPAIHDLQIGDATAQRIVLGDWYMQDSWLVCDNTGCRLNIY